MNAWLTRHAQTALGALGELSRQPLASALTVLVIGIALALPASLQVLVQGVQQLAGGWQDLRDFSVYLKPGTPIEDARALTAELDAREELEEARLVTADEALATLRGDPALGEALGFLETNPLPHTIVVRPLADAGTEELAALRTTLAGRGNVDRVQIDTEWLNRLTAILAVIRRTLLVAAVLLFVTVVAVVGNTIRLDIQNRRQEIEVSKLLGAEDSFVRRPFLYLGFWYGLLGGGVALAVLAASFGALAGPLGGLLALYGVEFTGPGITPASALLVFGTGLLSGLAGAWAAVARHLSAIEPKI